MSTRSYIMIETDDGKYKGIYCHSDGYLTHNGAILIDHYKTKEKVEELISLGNLSLLGKELNPNPNEPHSFDYKNRQVGVCVAYGRDRGESGQEAIVIPLKTIMNDPWIQYIYVFTKDNKWKYAEGCYYNANQTLRDVKEDIDGMFKEWNIERPKDLYGFYDNKAIRIIASEQKRKANI